MKNFDLNPMHKAHAAPRCTANCKRTGLLCKNPAVRGWTVCRMHGARGGAPKGKANGNYRHGANTREAQVMALLGRLVDREAQETLKQLSGDETQSTTYRGQSNE